MAEIRRIEDWRAPASMGLIYEQLLEKVGTAQFGATLQDAVMSVTAGARRLYLFEATSREETSLEYVFCEPRLVPLLPSYSARYHDLDPVCDAYSAAPRLSDIAIQRIRPRDIACEDFRRRFFDQAGIVERISVIQRGAHAWRVMNVARHRSHGLFSEQELDALIGLARLALPMVTVNRRRSEDRNPGIPRLEQRLQSLCPSLTRREREVCARATMGMSVEMTAIDLKIANTSVMTYRKRGYQRLGIGSVRELCALVAP